MTKNMGGFDRAARVLLVAPAAIVAAILLGPTSAASIALWVLAGLMLLTAATGYCVLYLPLGIDTRGTTTRSSRDRPAGAAFALNPNRLWWGLVFVALGVLGVLHVIGILDWNRTVGDWWPVALIGWGLTGMLAARRFSPIAAIVAAVGLGLLADEQRWTGRGIIWSAVFVGIGAAILLGPDRRKAPPSQPGPPPTGPHVQDQHTDTHTDPSSSQRRRDIHEMI